MITECSYLGDDFSDSFSNGIYIWEYKISLMIKYNDLIFSLNLKTSVLRLSVIRSDNELSAWPNIQKHKYERFAHEQKGEK